MKNINLLPKVPLVKSYFYHFLAGILSLVLLIGGLLTAYYIQLDSKINHLQSLEEQYSQQKVRLMQERTVDPQYAEYTKFLTERNRIKDSQRDWLPVWEAIVTNLPKASRILSMSGEKNETVELWLQMATPKEVAEYAVLLKASPLMDDVSVKSVQSKGLPVPLHRVGSPQALSTSAPPVAQQSTVGNNTAKNQGLYEAMIELRLKPITITKQGNP